MLEKKHYTQISQEEKTLLWGRLIKISPVFTKHAITRCQEKGINPILINCKVKIIEYNIHHGDKRVLLRQKNGLCYSVSLLTGQIITIYFNDPGDNHSTINWHEYNAKLIVRF
jgi:hypothetical protein